MKATDVVLALRANLPNFNNYFTDEFIASDISVSGTTATITAASPLPVVEGDYINIVNAKTDLSVISISKELRAVNQLGFTKTVILAVVVTSMPHRLNLQFTPSITISGANESTYNGEKSLYSIDSANQFTYLLEESAPNFATGGIQGFHLEVGLLNGLKQIYNVTANTFDYDIDIEVLPYTDSPPSVRYDHRIVRAYPIDRSLDKYTKQENFNKMVIFVTINDAVVSKSRQIESDASQTQNSGTETRQRLIQTFSVYVFTNTRDQIDAAKARDQMEDILPDLTRSLLRVVFPSQFSEAAWSETTFLGHGEYIYVYPYYAHVFNFETVFDITENDTVIPYSPSFNINQMNIDYKKIENDDIIMTSKIIFNEN